MVARLWAATLRSATIDETAVSGNERELGILDNGWQMRRS